MTSQRPTHGNGVCAAAPPLSAGQPFASPAQWSMPHGRRTRLPAWQTDRFRWTLQTVGVPLLATLLRVASSPTSSLSYLVIAGYALVGRSQAIVALFLCCMFNLISHGFPAGVPQSAALLRYAVFFAAAFSVIVHGRSPRAAPQGKMLLPFTFTVCLLIIGHSLAISPLLDVSLLEIISFTIVIMTILAGWSWMEASERQLTERIIFGSLILTAVASVPLLGTSMGYMMRRGLFQGVLVHPNNFGPVMAILAGVLAMQCLIVRPLKVWRPSMLLLAIAMMYLSRSRVSLVAFVSGIAVGFLIEACQGILARYRHSPRLVRGRLAFAGVALTVLTVSLAPRLLDFYQDFIRKGGGEAETIVEAFEQSRGFLMDILKENISQHPLTGIGFGVASDPDQWVGINRDPIFGLPLMFTIEKGVMPLAVIEELGYPLAIVVFLWLAMLALRSTRGGIVTVVAFTTAMITNLAESTFFSPGGMGLLVLLTVGWATTAPTGGAWLQRSTSVPNAG